MQKLFLIAGPSGIGKSHLMERLLKLYPKRLVSPPLITTRLPRSGEDPIDRQFVTVEEYQAMLRSDEFMWADSFYGNAYGYTHEAVVPKDKHIIINILPPMVPQFAVLSDAVVVGMTMKPDDLTLLESRLAKRGDPPNALDKRKAGWPQDMKLMSQHERIINAHGKLFVVENDETVSDIIEWLEGNYLHED